MNQTMPPPPKNLSDLALRYLERMAVRRGNGADAALAHGLAVHRSRLSPALEELVEAEMATDTLSLNCHIQSMTDEGKNTLLIT